VIDLDFSVEGAQALRGAVQPTLALKLRIATQPEQTIRSLSLAVQVRIAAPQRAYSPGERDHLLDLFGDPSRWGQTLKSLLWTITPVQIPSFRHQVVVDVPIVCTYDFEVATAKYLYALEDGEIPLELLFSGTVFYAGESSIQAQQVSWDKEARFRLPVQVWKDVMHAYFPNAAWLRIHKDTFDRLHLYRMRRAHPTWEAALDELLAGANAWTH
jgi:hypothetical protein